MPGPPPKPVEQKRALGNPGKQKLPNTAEIAALEPLDDSVPAHLGPDGRELWQGVTAAASRWLAPSDSLALLMLCELYDRRTEYKKCMTDYGTLIQRPNDGHLVANPAAQLLIQTEKQITDLASVLGLTPADRTRMGLAEVKAKNAFEELLAKRSQRG
jgi:P27 family predicted phage terminase small subunit